MEKEAGGFKKLSKGKKRRVSTSYAAAKARRPYVDRVVAGSRIHHFKQMYRPSSTALSFSSGATGSAYDANEGIIFGPDPASTPGDGYWSLYFTLNDLPQMASYSALFDCYRINKAVLKLTPFLTGLTTSNIATGTTATFDECMVTVLDFDDSTQLTSLSAAEEYETYKMTPSYKEHTRTLVPAVSSVAYKTALTFGYTQKTKQWVDIANPEVPHYGVKGVIQGPGTAANARRQAWWVRVKLYFSCKQVR